MNDPRFLSAPLYLLLFAAALSAQTPAPAKVDYANDVAPILRQNCVSCHGPSRQNGGLRLDRRSSALKASARRIVPGNTANSFLYHRIIGEFGQPMPPTGDLKPEQVATIKAWIEQGADWPDALANEVDLPPLDPEAIAAVNMLHKGELARFMKAVTAKPALLNARGPEGSTPFMYAALYTNAATLEKLLKLGANPNAHNDANATALMWAAHDLAKTSVLVNYHADVNVRSDDFRTALMVAARQPTGTPIVKLLLDHAANPNPNPYAGSQSSPLLEAATVGNADTFELLMQHGAEIKTDAEPILTMAVTTNCHRCLDLAVPKITDKTVYTSALQDSAVFGDTPSIQMMLDHGADAKAYDPLGRTALMYAVGSDAPTLETVKLLVAHGADVNAASKHGKSGDEGMTILDMAKLHGKTPTLDFLVASGAKPGHATPVALNPRFKNELRGAIQDSIPLLQQADAVFAKNSGCASCHNNSLTAMTIAAARKQGFAIDEKTARSQVHVNVDSLATIRELLHLGFLLPTSDYFSENIVAYTLIGLDAEGFKPDLDTDAAAMHILWRQSPNGEWKYPLADTRPPLCLDHIGNTALSIRALQAYAPRSDAAAYRRSVQLAGEWLATAQSYNNDDRSWRVAGLAWANTSKAATHRAIAELVSTQKPDGGWSDLPTMDSSAYATGKSLVALHIAGVPASDPAYKRGINWLLANQQQDGSWYVQTRAFGFQPWSDAGFPHHYDQFISAAGTNWAAMALTYALPDTKAQVASRLP